MRVDPWTAFAVCLSLFTLGVTVGMKFMAFAQRGRRR